MTVNRHLKVAVAGPRVAVCLAVLWSVWNIWWICPHQLAYFNELSGGPGQGYRHLVHSNLDWGQDLLLVRKWGIGRGIDPRTIRVESYGVLVTIADDVVSQGDFSEGGHWTVYSPNTFRDDAIRRRVFGGDYETVRIGYSLWAVRDGQHDD